MTGVCGILAGAWGKARFDRHQKDGRRQDRDLDAVIAQRADIEFQTRMTFLMQSLTAAIEKGHAQSAVQLEAVSVSLQQAVAAIRELHQELVEHREETGPAVVASSEILRRIQQMDTDQRRAAS